MIARYGISCPGCEQDILVRLSVYPSEGVRFYFPCPKCDIPITGSMRGENDIQTLKVQFDDCKKIDVDVQRVYEHVVTVAPNMPLKRGARNLSEVGGAPSAMILHIAGDNAELLLRRLSFSRQTLSTIWPHVRRFYEYYMQEQWELLAAAGKKAVNATFIDPGTVHGRESEAYRAVTICTLPLVTDPFAKMLDEVINHMELIFESSSFRGFALSSVASGDLQREQRRIWDCLCLLIRISELWLLPGLLWDLAGENPAISLDQLSLSHDEFHQLRDAYVACFEACCKAIEYFIAFVNTSERGAPEVFTQDLSPKLGKRGRRLPPKNFAQFRRLPNFEKLAYLYEWPAVDKGLNGILDNRLRNFLGHNSVRHDLRTGMIVSDEGVVMSYFEFTAKVYRLNTALHIIMNVLHSIRMATTEPLKQRTG